MTIFWKNYYIFAPKRRGFDIFFFFAARLPHVETEQCDHKIMLNENNERAVISSPNFPNHYPDNKNCLVSLSAPSSHKIVIVFEEFVLEEEPK